MLPAMRGLVAIARQNRVTGIPPILWPERDFGQNGFEEVGGGGWVAVVAVLEGKVVSERRAETE